MPELSFRMKGARAIEHAAAPTLALAVEIANRPEAEEIQSILLQAQVRIEAPMRTYSDGERASLRELFGEPERWSRTLRGLLWGQTTTVVRPFAGTGEAELLMPCTLDFNLAAAKYFHAIETGFVPLLLLFTGTVFYRDAEGALQAAPIPWSAEAGFLMPIALWRGLVDQHFPNLQKLYRYQVDRGLLSLEQAIESLLRPA